MLNLVFKGSIILNGGKGIYVIATASSGTQYHSTSAGGGGGSCIISTNNMISESGTFQSNGGNAGITVCRKRGGNGAMLIIKN